jgi:endonuclease/exonuclease/phosphatase family metal-dependent hydrolase
MRRALSALLPVLLTTCTAVPKPIPPLELETIAGESADERPLRVLTFNIQWALRGLDHVAQVIRAVNPDIVALQEVDNGTRRSNGLNQAKELARLTGLPYHQHFSATRMHGGEYGVAILSRFELKDAEAFALPNWAMTEARVVGRAVIDRGHGPLAIYVTHLTHLPTHGALRKAQAERILELASRDPRPKLLLGDLNEGPDGEGVSAFSRKLVNVFARRGEGPRETYPMPFFLPARVLDYVFASKGLAPRRSRVIPNTASDHYALFAEIDTTAEVAIEATTASTGSGTGSTATRAVQ